MSAARSPLGRLLACPDWLRTGTGRLAFALGALAVGLKTVAMIFPAAAPFDAAGIPAATFGAVLLAAWQIRHFVGRREENRQRRIAWRWFLAGLGLIGASALAQAVATIWMPQFAAVAHDVKLGLGLVALGLTVAGLRAWPADKLPRRLWTTAVLDLATVLLAGLLGFWVYVLFPLLSLPAASVFALATIAAYAAVSLLLLCVLLVLMFKRQERLTRGGTGALALGSVALVATETVPLCQLITFEGLGARSNFVGWALFALFLAVGARLMRDRAQRNAETAVKNWDFAVPFASTTLVGLLLFTAIASPESWQANMPVLLGATFSALVLIVVRQTIIARENLTLAQEMRRAKDIAESANSARLHFLANISHDLRTPLNGVLGCAQILLREKSLTGKQKDLLRTTQGCAEHLRNLINDLLDLSKLEADRLELAPAPLELRAFLGELTKSFSIEADRKNLQLDVEPAADLPACIQADRKRLQQIVGNLLHNAIKFTERGGVRLRARVKGAQLVIEVHDTGCGILPDKLKELFLPFHVADERSIRLDGTGLGLSIAKKLARKMGGDITVQSVISKGSVFTFEFPFQETAPLVEVQRTIVDYQGRRRRILIVDDQPANRIVLRAMLEPLDFLVDEAADGHKAIAQLHFAKPDIILMDLMMPGMDGFELCREVGALALVPAPVCFAVSALSGEEVKARCRATGFREFLQKPVSLELLLEALHTHAGIEWSYGVIQPAPTAHAAAPASAEPITMPPPDDVTAFIALARRGDVRNLQVRADNLAELQPEFAAFAQRVHFYTSDFKLKELAEWLAAQSPQPAHGSA